MSNDDNSEDKKPNCIQLFSHSKDEKWHKMIDRMLDVYENSPEPGKFTKKLCAIVLKLMKEGKIKG